MGYSDLSLCQGVCLPHRALFRYFIEPLLLKNSVWEGSDAAMEVVVNDRRNAGMSKLQKIILALFSPLLLLLFLLFLQINFAHAEGAVKSDVEVVLKQLKVVKHGDNEALEAAERIKPGEIVEYQTTYRNVSKHADGQLQATLPIPAETEYLPGSARPAAVQASVDGVNYAELPLRKKIKTAGGQLVEQDIRLSEYRSLRWTIGELEAGRKATVSAR